MDENATEKKRPGNAGPFHCFNASPPYAVNSAFIFFSAFAST